MKVNKHGLFSSEAGQYAYMGHTAVCLTIIQILGSPKTLKMTRGADSKQLVFYSRNKMPTT